MPRYSTEPIATVENKEINVWEHYDVTDYIKNVIENDANNFGFALDLDTCPTGVAYRSSEHDVVEERPKLTVTYENTTSIKPNTLKNTIFNNGSLHRVTVMNVKGQIVKSFTIYSLRELENIVASLAPGITLISVANAKNTIAIKRLLVK